MKRTVIAARDFSIDGISFLPGDEVDLIALGKSNIDFRSLVHARFLSYGVAGRDFDDIMAAHNKKLEAEKEAAEQAEEEIKDESTEAVEATEIVEAPVVNNRKRR